MFTKEFIIRVLVSIMVVVGLLILALVVTAGISKGFEDAKEIYQLVVVDTLVQPFVGIIAAFVVYTFGKNFARVMYLRNLMRYGNSEKDFDMNLE